MTSYAITEEQLRSLVQSERKLLELESMGVDNWGGYDEIDWDFINEETDLTEIARSFPDYTGTAEDVLDVDWRWRAVMVASGLLDIAESAMPDTYFASDSRCAMARETLALAGHERGDQDG